MVYMLTGSWAITPDRIQIYIFGVKICLIWKLFQKSKRRWERRCCLQLSPAVSPIIPISFHRLVSQIPTLLISVKGPPFFTGYVNMATALNAADVKSYVFHLSCHTAGLAPFLWKRSEHSWATGNGHGCMLQLRFHLHLKQHLCQIISNRMASLWAPLCLSLGRSFSVTLT